MGRWVVGFRAKLNRPTQSLSDLAYRQGGLLGTHGSASLWLASFGGSASSIGDGQNSLQGDHERNM